MRLTINTGSHTRDPTEKRLFSELNHPKRTRGKWVEKLLCAVNIQLAK